MTWFDVHFWLVRRKKGLSFERLKFHGVLGEITSWTPRIATCFTIFHHNDYHFSCFNLHFPPLFHRFSPFSPQVAALQLPGLRAQRGAGALGGARRGAAEAAPAAPGRCQEARHGEIQWLGWVGGKRVCLKIGLSENSVPLNPMVNDHYPY